jgi:hypothetical protein
MLEIFVNKSVSSSIRTSRLMVLVGEEARFMLSKCLFYYILLKTPKGYTESVKQRRTDNTISIGKRTKRQ